jgi:quinol monooxygenase YgiN
VDREGFRFPRRRINQQGGVSQSTRKDRVMNSNAADEVGGIIAAFAAQVGHRQRPLALIARFRVRAGTGGRIERAFAEASVQTAREAGVLAYQLHREPDSSDAFIVYERWRSLEDLEAQLRTSYIGALRAEIGAVMEGQPSFQVMLPT